MRIELPPTFYDDHAFRDLPAGTVIRRKARTVEVEVTIAELVEILDDARFHLENAEAGAWCEPEHMFGLLSSARATVKRITPVLAALDPAEVKAAVDAALAEERIRIAEERERFEAGRERREAEAAERRAAAEAERQAHPRLSTVYAARIGMPIPWIFGLRTNADLKVGAILVTENRSEYEITALGEERRGDYPTTVRGRDGVEHAAKIEVQEVTRA